MRLVVVFLSLGCVAHTQTKSAVPQMQKPVGTSNVQCDQSWLHGESNTVSSNTGARAYVELTGKTLVGKTQDDNRCYTTWTLHISSPGSKTWNAIVVHKKDEEWYFEHDFEIIGWSVDGKRLLLAIMSAAGDGDETIPVIYDVGNKKFWVVNLHPLFKQYEGETCTLYFRPLGFTSEGDIGLDLGALDQDDLPEGQKPCFATSRWSLTFPTSSVHQLANSVPLQHYGRMDPP
jgi:hypothetical protein